MVPSWLEFISTVVQYSSKISLCSINVLTPTLRLNEQENSKCSYYGS